MNYRSAKKIKIGDAIIIKDTKDIVVVMSTNEPRPMNMIHRKNIYFQCDDGNSYHHTEVQETM